MMPVVRINDTTFADLSTLKTWLGTKSPSETIDHLVRQALDELGIERGDDLGETAPRTATGVLMFDVAPSLAFTKPLSATINGKSLPSPKWATILLAVIQLIKERGFTGERLLKALAVPAKIGSYEQEGYKFHPELGISIQGQSATDAWKEADRLAAKWQIPLVVEFMWRQNPKAQHPGQTGQIRSGMAARS